MDGKPNGIPMDKIDPLDAQVKANYLGFKDFVTKTTLSSLRERIPKKILHFNSLVNAQASDSGNLFHAADLDQTSYAVNVPESNCRGAKRPLENDTQTSMPTVHHKQIKAELEVIKCEASQLIEIIGNIKLWIQLNVPRIEDGNNFGVGIQEEVIQELTRVEDTAFNLYDAIVKYYMARAKLCTKVLKYPKVADYHEAIRELDEKEWIHIKITRVDMRNNYSMLYDLLCKNWEKIVKPKSEDGHYRMTF